MVNGGVGKAPPFFIDIDTILPLAYQKLPRIFHRQDLMLFIVFSVLQQPAIA